jgi:hypothetical protein
MLRIRRLAALPLTEYRTVVLERVLTACRWRGPLRVLRRVRGRDIVCQVVQDAFQR